MPPRKSNPASADSPGEIVSTRVFASAREELFGAFSDPQQLASWWGPKGFTNTFHQFDFHPGGAWRFNMMGPDGTAFEMDHQFTEIVRPERIVVRHIQQAHDFTLTMSFVAQDGATKLTWRMRFDDPAECGRVRAFVIPANEQNFDRLAAHLSARRPVDR
ncbi:MAG: SRPBCC family protein [Phycisphaerae bacterium]|jgi:uncharacterized protein YndB with AHSA1/START domain